MDLRGRNCPIGFSLIDCSSHAEQLILTTWDVNRDRLSRTLLISGRGRGSAEWQDYRTPDPELSMNRTSKPLLRHRKVYEGKTFRTRNVEMLGIPERFPAVWLTRLWFEWGFFLAYVSGLLFAFCGTEATLFSDSSGPHRGTLRYDHPREPCAEP